MKKNNKISEKLLIKKLKKINEIFSNTDLIVLYKIRELIDIHIERKEDIKNV